MKGVLISVSLLFMVLFASVCMASNQHGLSIVGTYTDTDIIDGKYVDKDRFETLPKKWSKNGNYYNALLINDPANTLGGLTWEANIRVIKDGSVIKSVSIPSSKSKKISDFYFLTAFSKFVPLYDVDAPYRIEFKLDVSGLNRRFVHSMYILGGH